MTPSKVNLMPVALVRRCEHFSQLRKWAPVWLGVAALLTAAQLFLLSRIEDAHTTLSDLRQRVRPLHALVERTATLEGKSATLTRSINRRLLLEQSDVPLAMLHTVAFACQPHGVRLESFRLEDASSSAQPDQPGSRSAPGKHIVLKGSAESDVTVSKFISELRGRGLFSSVLLESTQDNAGAAALARTFQLRCEWNVSAPTTPTAGGR